MCFSPSHLRTFAKPFIPGCTTKLFSPALQFLTPNRNSRPNLVQQYLCLPELARIALLRFVVRWLAIPLLGILGIVSCSCSGISAQSSPAQPTPFGRNAIPSTFFGFDISSNNDPWPTPQFLTSIAGWRTLGGSVKWSDIEPSCDGGTDPANPCYAWTRFDTWASKLQVGQDILFTLFWTPTWASSNPVETCNQKASNFTPGGCFPPNDLNADGTGTDQYWTNFLTALYQHAANQGHRIAYYECWNEPNNGYEWNGTIAQLVRMCKDLHDTISALDPKAKFTSPPQFKGRYHDGADWDREYFSAGGGQWADIIGFHGYMPSVSTSTSAPVPTPETIVPWTVVMQTVMGDYGQSGKPLWNTEDSWDDEPTCYEGSANFDQQKAFVSRFLILSVSLGTQRTYWYTWDDADAGTGWYDPTKKTMSGAMNAYNTVYQWLVGNTITTPCTSVGSVWTCGITTASNQPELIVWDASQTCAGSCTTSNYTVISSTYTVYSSLEGNAYSIPSSRVIPIGAKPVLLGASR